MAHRRQTFLREPRTSRRKCCGEPRVRSWDTVQTERATLVLPREQFPVHYYLHTCKLTWHCSSKNILLELTYYVQLFALLNVLSLRYRMKRRLFLSGTFWKWNTETTRPGLSAASTVNIFDIFREWIIGNALSTCPDQSVLLSSGWRTFSKRGNVTWRVNKSIFCFHSLSVVARPTCENVLTIVDLTVLKYENQFFRIPLSFTDRY